MKTIQLTDQEYDFLMQLSNELNTQDNRATASPYFYQVRETKHIPTGENMGNPVCVLDDTVLRTEEEIKQAVFEYQEWNLSCEAHQRKYKYLSQWDIEAIMEHNYRQCWETTTEVYSNAFLTEKAVKEHIRLNRHNLSAPQDYLQHAYRNPELEQLLEILKRIGKENYEIKAVISINDIECHLHNPNCFTGICKTCGKIHAIL